MKELSTVVFRANHATRSKLQVILCALAHDAEEEDRRRGIDAVHEIIEGLKELEGEINKIGGKNENSK